MALMLPSIDKSAKKRFVGKGLAGTANLDPVLRPELNYELSP